MRILFAVHGYKPAWRIGGPIVSVSALAEGLVKRGHEVIVFTTDSNLDESLDVETDCPLDVEGVQVWYFRRGGVLKRLFSQVPYVSKSTGFLYSPQMARALEGVVPTVDLVHTHLPFVYPTFAAACAAFRFRKPLFYHQRGLFDPQRLKFRSLKKMLYLRMVEVPILRRVTTLIALTKAEASNYARLGVSTPCRIIPNGIDAGMYARPIETNLIEPLGIRPEHTVILFLGRIHPIKGADRLLEAFLSVQKSFPEAMLVLAGPDEFNLESGFRKRADASGLTHGIVFPGMVQGEIKAQLLARADLFCLPSDAEGFSIAVLEALASSTAVLLSTGCHFPEVEAHGAGKVTETDPQALASALRELLVDPEELKRMGKRGRDLVISRYSWDGVTDAILDAYAEGLDRHAKTASCQPL